MIKVVVFLALSGSPLLMFFAYAQTAYYGSVEGQVISNDGKPVARAKVYAHPSSPQPEGTWRMGAFIYTDEQGRFTLRKVPLGEATIHAFKESEGVPDLMFSFYTEAYGVSNYPKVMVEKEQAARNVLIRLSPPASRLLISVVDARTRQPVLNSGVAMNHKGKPMTLFRSGATEPNGKFSLLVPSSIPINIVVEAPGYKGWRYTSREAVDRDALRLPPDSSKELIVELEPIG